MALSTLQQINDALPSAQQITWQKQPQNPGAGLWSSSWTAVGLPSQGAAPSSGLAGDVPTDATAGGLPFVNPVAGNTYLGRAVGNVLVSGTIGGAYAIYDRLWQDSGISSTSVVAQTVNSVALTRPDANGTGAEAWFEVYVVMGAGTPTVTLSYTNSAGTAGRSATSGVLATTMPVGRTGPFDLVAGDTGVKSIQTWTSSATFTSGTIGLVIRRLVAVLPVAGGGVRQAFTWLDCGLPRVYDDACLEVLFFAQSVSSVTSCPQTFFLIQG